MNAKSTRLPSRLKNLNPVFHKKLHSEDNDTTNSSLLRLAKKSGKLILSSKNLISIPANVLALGDIHSEDNDVHLDRKEGGSWWEMVPLTHLDVSSNSIAAIPTAINKLDTLTVFLVQDNSLKTIPIELSHLHKLTKLDLGNNKLQDLPVELSALKELKWLNISGNQFTAIPDSIYDLVMLQHLDMSKNKMLKMAPGLGFLVRLTHLNLSHNQLHTIPPDVSNCKALVDLDLSFNVITSEGLPPLGDLHSVQIIQLTNNKLNVLPSLNGCSNLKELHLGHNKMKILIPQDQEQEVTVEELSTLSHMQVVVLRDNLIETLPREMSCMQNLQRLDLTNNNLTELPATLALLPHLHNLLIDGNSLRSIRRDLITGGTQRLLKHLKQTLPLSDEDKQLISSLPCQSSTTMPDRFSMRSSCAVNLASRNLCNIPESVFDEAIEVPCSIVDFSRNRLTEVPSGIWKLGIHLTDLNLSHNQLKTFPDLVMNCVNLAFLSLETNVLTSLPNGLEECKRLREINIACNRFVEIPQCLYNIAGLEILIARDNKITALDADNLKKIKSLSSLDVTNNSIASVPPQLGLMTQIRNLGLEGNGLRAPRQAILAKGTDAILSWLRDKIPT